VKCGRQKVSVVRDAENWGEKPTLGVQPASSRRKVKRGNTVVSPMMTVCPRGGGRLIEARPGKGRHSNKKSHGGVLKGYWLRRAPGPFKRGTPSKKKKKLHAVWYTITSKLTAQGARHHVDPARAKGDFAKQTKGMCSRLKRGHPRETGTGWGGLIDRTTKNKQSVSG